MSVKELEIICTDRNLINNTFRYMTNEGNYYTPEQIIERMRDTSFIVRMERNIVELKVEHFDDSDIDEKNRTIRDFVRNLPEC